MMDPMMVDNDTRGWIMTAVSGVACVFGASIICIDLIVQYIPSKRHFKIEESTVFQAASMSLSFGVMIFSSLVGMMPSAKAYLREDFSGRVASFILLGCFLAGFVGIQIATRFLHQHIPSHVVDCDHTHDELPHSHTHQSRSHSQSSHQPARRHSHSAKSFDDGRTGVTDSTPLLNGDGRVGRPRSKSARSRRKTSLRGDKLRRQSTVLDRRPSMAQIQERVMSFVQDKKSNCDEAGPCFGYSDRCGQECLRHIVSKMPSLSRVPSRTATINVSLRHGVSTAPSVDDVEEASEANFATAPICVRSSRASSRDPAHLDTEDESECEDIEAQHHHHVPENAFLSIGLQTTMAIALHKLPEGFITYATNHANPALGFSVFMALFVHNITEGFVMALPLYLALHSRIRAMFWSSLLGGISQPLGAGIAAIWFKLAKNRDHAPGSTVYGCMFAVTAGIMTSVALMLFVEALSMNHNRNLCIGFALLGMSILGVSNALTSE